MKQTLPEYLCQGEVARLFPVLSTTSKEGRTTSILLATLSQVREFGAGLLGLVGQRIGKTAEIVAYTEVVFKNQKIELKDRPDGLIVVRVGKREWRALVEAKVGNSRLDESQIERYRTIARNQGIDCVITISNQFASSPVQHPIAEVRKSRSRIPVYHWSWMKILTEADLLISNREVGDEDQFFLLRELHRFLGHESAGVQGFGRMPSEWTDINKLVSSGGNIPAKSDDAAVVVEAWHQETKDLSLILSRLTETEVIERVPRKQALDSDLRTKEALQRLKDEKCLCSTLMIPDAAAPLEITADLGRRSFDIGMTLRAPDNRVSSKARLNWLLRQVKKVDVEDIFVRLIWPRTSEDTQFPLSQLIEEPDIINVGKEHLAVRKFHIFLSKRVGARFAQRTNFISDLEAFVPEFYDRVGSRLVEWKKPAPKIKPGNSPTVDPDEKTPDTGPTVFND